MHFRQRFLRQSGDSVRAYHLSQTSLPSSPSQHLQSDTTSPMAQRTTRNSKGLRGISSEEDYKEAEPRNVIEGVRLGRVTRRSATLTMTRQNDSPKPYLLYHDLMLMDEDIKALKHDWLTDNNIAFWEEWLEREILPRYPRARISLLRPTLAFILLRDPSIASITNALPSFHKVTHIFLPVNDNRNVNQAEGGSHWSLLLVSVIDRVAFHYDSLGGANYNEAYTCAHKLGEVLRIKLDFLQIRDCPQQENSMDCGVFVCILMRHLLVKRLLNANASEKVSMSMEGKMIDSSGGRKEMYKIIESLRKEGERRRSASPFASSSSAPPRIQ